MVYWVAITVPAPGMGSTTMRWPRAGLMPSAIMRAMVSMALPPGKGTMSRIGLIG